MRSRMIFAFVLSSLFVSKIALAHIVTSEKECTLVNLSEVLGPVWDQEDTGMCYAVAVADFLSYFLKERVSAPDVAVVNLDLAPWVEKEGRHLIMGPQNWTMGALPGMALARVSKVGACPASQAKDLDFDSVNAKLVSKSTDVQDSCLSGQRTPRFEADLDIEGPGTVDGTWEDVPPVIHDELNNKRILMMLYDYGPALELAGHGLHVSTIVGRKWSPEQKQCLYLIRNSWGPGFGDNGYRYVSEANLLEAVDSVYAMESLRMLTGK